MNPSTTLGLSSLTADRHTVISTLLQGSNYRKNEMGVIFFAVIQTLHSNGPIYIDYVDVERLLMDADSDVTPDLYRRQWQIYTISP